MPNYRPKVEPVGSMGILVGRRNSSRHHKTAFENDLSLGLASILEAVDKARSVLNRMAMGEPTSETPTAFRMVLELIDELNEQAEAMGVMDRVGNTECTLAGYPVRMNPNTPVNIDLIRSAYMSGSLTIAQVAGMIDK